MRILAESVIREPRRLRDIAFVLRLMRTRASGAADNALTHSAEALSMAVTPSDQDLVPSGGTSRVAVRLFQEMTADLAQRQADRVVLHVDPKNKAANMFYSALGCKFRSITHAGLTRHLFEYELRPVNKTEHETAR
jgi:predicted GNAT family acetyltransferase